MQEKDNKLVSVLFLLFIIIIAYCNRKEPKKMIIYSTLLLFLYLVYYQSELEKFDTSLDILYDTIKEDRPHNNNNNLNILANLETDKDNSDHIKTYASQIHYQKNLKPEKDWALPLNVCYDKILKILKIDDYDYFLIHNNKQYLGINYELKQVNVSKTNKPHVEHDRHGFVYPEYIKNDPQKWYIRFIGKAKVNNRNKNKVDICTFNLYTKSDHPEIPTYYLQYSANNVEPVIFKGGSNQVWILEKDLKSKGFKIRASNGKYLTRTSETYINGSDIIGLKSVCNESCVWIFDGFGTSTCRKNNQTVGETQSCCSQYIEQDGRCVLPKRLSTIGRFAKYYDSPTDIFNNRIKNITPGQQKHLGKNAWIDSYKNIWNGYYTNYKTNSSNYNKKLSNSINVKVRSIRERAKGHICTELPDGIILKFNVQSLGSDILYGSDGKGNNIIAHMLPYETIKKLFSVKLNDKILNNDLSNNVSLNSELMNTVVVRFLVYTPTKIINLGVQGLNNLHAVSFKMISKNLSEKVISIYEAVNLIH